VLDRHKANGYRVEAGERTVGMPGEHSPRRR
jgi:hypothetical protein